MKSGRTQRTGRKPWPKISSRIVIGTRGSELALVQANIVAKALKKTDPKLSVEIRTITTHGDTDQRPIPGDANGKGWFTKEIEQELLAGAIDIAVHSLKDVGELQPKGLMLAAYLSREDARDALITKDGEPLEKLRTGAVVGTDSPRRQAQMLAMRADLNMTSLRGNVPTRLAKLDGTFSKKSGEIVQKYDAIILAVAGLKRLGLQKRITRIFEPDEMMPAPGQGILTIQARSADAAVLKILKKINHADAMRVAEIERSFARAVGAGCKSPTGAYAYRDGNECCLMAMIAEEDGTNMIRGEMRAPWNKSSKIGRALAMELLKKQKRRQKQKTILIVGGKETAESISDAVKRKIKAAKIVLLHPTKIRRVALDTAAKSMFTKLADYDWIFFSSKNAVRFFALELCRRKLEISKTGKIKVAAVGPETAEALKAEHIRVNFIPKNFSTEDMVAGLSVKLKGKRVLFPRSVIAPQDVVQEIEKKGARVDVMNIYTNLPLPVSVSKMKPLKTGSVDVIIFTSPSAADGFLKNLKQKSLLSNALKTPVICIGPSTAESARKAGFKKVTVADEASADSVAQKIASLLGARA